MKKQLAETSFRNLRAQVQKTQEERTAALNEYNAAEEGTDAKSIAGQKFMDADEKLSDLDSRYEKMSEEQYSKFHDKNKELQNGGSGSSSGLAGTFSAFEMGSVRGNSIEETLKTQVKQQIIANSHLARISRGLEENNNVFT
jgi:hypothetical protein